MSMTRNIGTALALLLMATSGLSAQTTAPSMPSTSEPAPSGPIGEWLVEKAIARIRIVDCSGDLWGVVSWEAKPGVDSKNPDTDLRTRPTLGMPVLLGMTQAKPNRWDGKIYNSQDGRTYSADISLRDPDTLRVEGCVIGILCGGENWSRVAPPVMPNPPPQPLPKTAQPAPKAAARTQAPSAPVPGSAGESNENICLRVASSSGLTH